MRASKLKPYLSFIAVGIAVVCSMVMLLRYGAIQTYDCASYLEAWKRISVGVLDIDRTPVYPAFIAFAGAIAGRENMLLMTVVLQHVISWVALWYFFKIAIRVVGSETVAFWLSVIVAVVPVFTMWQSYILTESLAASGSVFLLYSAVCIYDGRSRWHLLGFFVWLMFLIFLRPAFVYLLPVLFVAFLLMLWQKRWMRRRVCAGIAVVVAVSVSLLLYMHAFQRQYGVFAVTRVSLYNDYFIMRQNGTIDPQKTDNKELRDFIEESYKEKGRGPNKLDFMTDLFPETDYVVKGKWDMPTVSRLLRESRGENTKAQLVDLARRLFNSGKYSFFDSIDTSPFDVFNFTLGWIYLFLAAYFVALCVRFRKTKTVDWLDALMIMMGASNIIVIVVGSMAEYTRLITPSRFIYILMIAEVLCRWSCREVIDKQKN